MKYLLKNYYPSDNNKTYSIGEINPKIIKELNRITGKRSIATTLNLGNDKIESEYLKVSKITDNIGVENTIVTKVTSKNNKEEEHWTYTFFDTNGFFTILERKEDGKDIISTEIFEFTNYKPYKITERVEFNKSNTGVDTVILTITNSAHRELSDLSNNIITSIIDIVYGEHFHDSLSINTNNKIWGIVLDVFEEYNRSDVSYDNIEVYCCENSIMFKIISGNDIIFAINIDIPHMLIINVSIFGHTFGGHINGTELKVNAASYMGMHLDIYFTGIYIKCKNSDNIEINNIDRIDVTESVYNFNLFETDIILGESGLLPLNKNASDAKYYITDSSIIKGDEELLKYQLSWINKIFESDFNCSGKIDDNTSIEFNNKFVTVQNYKYNINEENNTDIHCFVDTSYNRILFNSKSQNSEEKFDTIMHTLNTYEYSPEYKEGNYIINTNLNSFRILPVESLALGNIYINYDGNIPSYISELMETFNKNFLLIKSVYDDNGEYNKLLQDYNTSNIIFPGERNWRYTIFNGGKNIIIRETNLVKFSGSGKLLSHYKSSENIVIMNKNEDDNVTITNYNINDISKRGTIYSFYTMQYKINPDNISDIIMLMDLESIEGNNTLDGSNDEDLDKELKVKIINEMSLIREKYNL